MESPACRGENVSRCYPSRDWAGGDPFDLYRCDGNGVMFTHPQPEDLGAYYPVNYRRFQPFVSAVFRTIYRRQVAQYTRRLGARGTVLEIGCGEGWMLEAFRDRGWNAVGFERTPEFANETARRTGLQVHSGSLDAIQPDASFDLVILYNVLEHLTDPGEAIRHCKRLVKPTGSVIITVPNVQSWQARLTKGRWFHLDVPRHLFHFSPGSMGRFLAGHGFTIGSRKNVSLAHDLFGWLQSAQNLLFREQNRMYKQLTKSASRAGLLSLPFAVDMGVFLVLLGPALLALAASWAFGSGAIFEVTARPGSTD